MPFVPPVTVTSPFSNPVTSSEKVNFAVNASTPTTSFGTPISSVGAVASHAAVACADTVLLPPSRATSFRTDTVTSPVPDGVTTSV